MTRAPAAFAIPGDINTPTGGYVYERKLLEALRAGGRDVAHLEIGPSFPEPTPADMEDLIEQLMALCPGRPVILDGFLSATIETSALIQLAVPTLAMVHHPLALESGLQEARRDELHRIERDNLAHVAHVLVPSPHTAEILTTRYDVAPKRITIARPGTDRVPLVSAPVEPPLILSVGIQHPRKGHDILLAALAQLLHLDWQAIIVGSAHDEGHAAELRRLVDRYRLQDRVRLAGRVADGVLAGLYGQASVFALATRYEGYGLVFDEALLAGLPIVSCATGAVPDTVPKGAGTLVPPENADAFAGALSALLTDSDLRRCQAEAASQAGAGLPRWSDTAQTVGQVLDRLALSCA